MAEKTKNGFNLSEDKTAVYGHDIITPLCRVGFADGLSVAKSSKAGAPPKYSCNFLAGKTDEKAKPELKAMQEMCKLMLVDLFGANATAKYASFKDERKMFRDGDTPSSTGKIYEGCAGSWVIVAKNAFPAGHHNGFTCIKKLPEQFQSGMLVYGVVQPYLNQDGFSWQLRTIKFVEDDGVRFGGAPDPSGLLDGLGEAVAAVNNSEVSIDLGSL